MLNGGGISILTGGGISMLSGGGWDANTQPVLAG